MAETVFELSDYPVYNPNQMEFVFDQYTARVPVGGTCSLGFYVPLAELPTGYQNAAYAVNSSVIMPSSFGLQSGFLTMSGFVPNVSEFRNDLVYSQDGADYLVPMVLIENTGSTINRTTVSSVSLHVTDGGQAPVRLGSNGIKGVRLGETPVVGLRLGDKKLF